MAFGSPKSLIMEICIFDENFKGYGWKILIIKIPLIKELN